MGQANAMSLKALALSVLAQSRSVPASVPAKVSLGTGAEPSPLPPCGSPDCARCYDVGDGREIHPPKCGEEYLKWLKRWQLKGKLQ